MIRTFLENYFNQQWYEQWYEGTAKHWLWSPLSKVYERQIRKRRQQYLERKSQGVLENLPPVLVVGNITVGGTGKTPLVIYLIEHLRAIGLRVGVVSRGYGGRSENYPVLVSDDSKPAQVGDEPYMIFQRTGVPIVVDPKRLNALRFLANHDSFDLIISDDGLQHYQLPRQFEIVVLDGKRGMGNGGCLPLGPLREPLDRLLHIDAVVVNGEPSADCKNSLARLGRGYFNMQLQPQQFIDLYGNPKSLQAFNEQTDIHAIAGIGNPQRFFDTLAAMGIQYTQQAFPDHHAYTKDELLAFRGKTLLMTEKDAVKARQVLPPQAWAKAFYLAVTAELSGDLINDIIISVDLKSEKCI
ncbi:MAG: tetraacyldisaccharide 4'-kinase [Pseudomonadales bacterium]|nr:tetraacyldisaccharide 4'-kinase [Pseudomonadales bacterium]